MRGEEGKTAKIVLSRRSEIDDIQRNYPELTETVARFEQELRDRLRQISGEIGKFGEEYRELVSTAVIHGIHRMTDEIFL